MDTHKGSGKKQDKNLFEIAKEVLDGGTIEFATHKNTRLFIFLMFLLLISE